MPSTYNRQDAAQKVSGDVSHHITSARRIHLGVVIAVDRVRVAALVGIGWIYHAVLNLKPRHSKSAEEM